MNFENHLDRCIFLTIQGRTATDPQTLMGILAGVDGKERLVLTREELAGGLLRLIHAGYIVEIEPLKFCVASEPDSPGEFSGISDSDHAKAVQEYHDWFQRKLAELDDEPGVEDFVWRKIVLRWMTPAQRWPTEDDEDRAEQLATLIDPILEESRLGEINGFEQGSGYIDVLIFGKATDADVDRLYELVAGPFRQFKCPPGSSIIRIYNERDEQTESDVVPACP